MGTKERFFDLQWNSEVMAELSTARRTKNVDACNADLCFAHFVAKQRRLIRSESAYG